MKKGFTLIELLAVVLMIGILTSIALPQYKRSVRRSEAMEAMINLRALFDSAKRTRAANSESPTALRQLDVDFFDADSRDSATFNAGNYTYTFASDGVSAAKNSGDANDTYTFKMYYKRGGQKDVMTVKCTASNIYICKSFGSDTPDSSGEYIIE